MRRTEAWVSFASFDFRLVYNFLTFVIEPSLPVLLLSRHYREAVEFP